MGRLMLACHPVFFRLMLKLLWMIEALSQSVDLFSALLADYSKAGSTSKTDLLQKIDRSDTSKSKKIFRSCGQLAKMRRT